MKDYLVVEPEREVPESGLEQVASGALEDTDGRDSRVAHSIWSILTTVSIYTI